MTEPLRKSPEPMPVDFVTFNWWVNQNGYGHFKYIVGSMAESDVPNPGEIVTGINVIDRDLAEVKFEGGFVFVKNLNTYGKMVENIESDESES